MGGQIALKGVINPDTSTSEQRLPVQFQRSNVCHLNACERGGGRAGEYGAYAS